MTGKPVCIYDANVLYLAQLRDLLMRVAVGDLLRAHWTDRIHEEWMRNVVADYPDVSHGQLDRTRRLMDRALPDARVSRFERHVEKISLPDTDDRHVVATAVEAGADLIVTFNLTDFPSEALDSHGVSAIHPDELVQSLLSEKLTDVLKVMHKHRRSLRRPPKSAREYIDMLRRTGLEQTARTASGHADRI